MSLPLSGDWLACYLLLMHAPLSLSLSTPLPSPFSLSTSLPRARSVAHLVYFSLFLSHSCRLFFSLSIRLLILSQPLSYNTPVLLPQLTVRFVCRPPVSSFFFRFWSGGVRESLCGGRMNEHLFTAGLPVRWSPRCCRLRQSSDRAVGRSWICVSASHASQLRGVMLFFAGGGGLFGRWE